MSEEQISPEVAQYLERLNTELETEKMKSLELQKNIGQISSLGGSTTGKEGNIVEFQLDLKEELERIYHLLSGHEVRTKENGSEYWAEPEDDRLKILSTYGVKQIMNILSMYVNKNTLLAFYDDTTIKWKVRDFGIELSDLFGNRYEALLHYPTPEDLFERYKPIVREKRLQITDEELYNKCIVWSEEELQVKERHIPIICNALIDMVHSAYMRAYLGKERQSLGERGINISQNTNPNLPNTPIPNKQGGFFGK